MLKTYFMRVYHSTSVQWDIIRKVFIATFLSSLLTSWIIIIPFLIRIEIEAYNLKPVPVLLLTTLSGMILSIIITIIIGFSVSRRVKKGLDEIENAQKVFARGRLDYRLDIEEYTEFEQISVRFNHMAQKVHKQVESLQRLVSENKSLLQGAEEAASTEERRKIARELHDAISQQLFAISTTISALPRLMDRNPESAKKYLERVGEMVTTAQQELRALIMHLRPVNLEGVCLKEGIEGLLKELDEKHPNIGIRWKVEIRTDLKSGIEDNLFRVAQEAISNILRHSKADKFSLKLIERENMITMFVEDNGIGFTKENQKRSSYGMQTISERIEEIGGNIEVISYPNRGTRIEVRVPISYKKEAKEVL